MAIIFIVLFFSVGFAQLTTFEKEAKSFEIAGISIGISLASFLEIYPDAKEKQDDDERVGLAFYSIDNLTNAQYSVFEFYNNKLCKIAMFYPGENMARSGGIEEFLIRLTDKIGDIDKKNIKHGEDKFGAYVEAVWHFNKVQRKFVVKGFISPGSILFILSDTVIEKKIPKKKSNSNDFGF